MRSTIQNETPHVWLNERKAVSTKPTSGFLYATLKCLRSSCWVLAALILSAPVNLWAYENDGPGYDPNAPRKMKTAKKSSSSSFDPPPASDICFVVTKGGDIGVTKGEDETISIPLDIPRYFGDKKKLLKSKALSEYAVLEMIVWDVDSKASYDPEVDEVYLNGKKHLGTLWGDNQEHYKNTFIIKTEDLNLAEVLGGVGHNTIDIKVDVNYGGWITRVEWISLYIPAAPPVILAHGINSHGGQLAKLAKEIEDETGLPTLYQWNFENSGNNHIDRFSELGAIIQSYKKMCHVDHVNIVGHSMGGLRARGYAENASDVFKVLQVGTPNGGAPMADFMIDWEKYVELGLQQEVQLGNMNPQEVKSQIEKAKTKIKSIAEDLCDMKLDPWRDNAIVCLQRNWMAEYNAKHKLNANVDYCVVAGNVTDYQLSFMQKLGRDVVGVFYMLSKDKANINKSIKDFIDHYFEQQLPINDYVGYAKAYLEEHLNELLVDTLFTQTDLIVPVYSAHTKVNPVAGSPLSGKRSEVWHSGLIEDGAERVVKCLKPKLVEQKKVATGTKKSLAAKNKSMSMRKAANNVTNAPIVEEKLDSVANDIQTGVMFSGKNTSASFGIVQGHHTMVVLNISTDAIKSTDLRLKSPSGKVYEDCAQNVLITNGVSNAVVMLANPEKGKWTLEWTSEFSNSADIGIWTLSAIEVDDGVVFSPKLANASVAVGNAFALTVSPKVGNSAVSGTAKIVATLPNGTSAIYNATRDASGVFSAQIPATVEGQYTFAVTLDATSPSAFSRSCIISGVAHSGGVAFLESHSASVADADSNGLYDNLIVNFAVNATKAGTYRVLATLSDKEGHEITQGWTSNIVCAVGTQAFPVAFDGRAIYENGECGGYVVSSAKLLEIGERYEAVVDTRSNLFTTTDYNYNQFEHSLVAMKSGGSDTATDFDGDGIYDQLDVTIPLYADDLASGSYEWSASLMDAEGVLLGTAAGNVRFTSGSGGSSIEMSFDAEGIKASSLNGPYYVKNLILWGSGRTFTIGDEYATKAYKIQQWGGTPKYWTVTFDANGGTGTMAAQTFTHGEAQALSANAFSRTGYTFAGWATSAGGEVTYADKSSLTVSEDTTLYAKWILNTYTVAFDANGGSGTMAAQQFSHGVAQGLSRNAFVRKHYKFTGWATSPNGTVVYSDGQSIKVTANATLYAVWEQDVRTLGGSSASANFSQALTFTAYTLSEDSGEISGLITIKTKKEKGGVAAATVTIQPVGGKKQTIKGTISTTDGMGQGTLAGLTFTAGGVTGTLNGYSVDGAIDASKSKDAATVAVLNAFKGKSFVMALEPEATTGENAAMANGVAGLSVVFSMKGKAKVTGTMPDGTKVSVSSQLIVGSEWCCLPVVYSKTGNSLAFLLWFDREGNFDSVSGMTAWKGKGFEVKWNEDVAVSKVGNLPSTSYFHLTDKPIEIGGAKVISELLPVDVAITPAGTKWNITKAKAVKLDRYGNLDYGVNPSGLKLTYTAKTGMFKGAFLFYTMNSGRLKKNKATVSGIVVDGVGYGTATLKKVGCWPIVINDEAAKAADFKAKITGIAVIDRQASSSATYGGLSFVPPETVLDVPYNKRVVFRIEYEIPADYLGLGTVWIASASPDAENLEVQLQDRYEGKGVGYNAILLREGGKTRTLKSVNVAIYSSPTASDSDSEWLVVCTTEVNLTFRE